MAIFFAVVKSVDTSPHDFLFAPCRPCASAVRRSAFTAHKQFGQCIFAWVFALLCFCSDLFDFRFAGSSCKFLLDSAEGSGINDCRMIVFYIVFRSLSVINLYFFADAVINISFVDNRISLVFLIRENGLDGGTLPYIFTAGRWDRCLQTGILNFALCIRCSIWSVRRRSEADLRNHLTHGSMPLNEWFWFLAVLLWFP